MDFRQLWLLKAKEANIPEADMYNVGELVTGTYYWLDGKCGYQIAYGSSPLEAIDRAIQCIRKTLKEIEEGKLVAFTPVYY